MVVASVALFASAIPALAQGNHDAAEDEVKFGIVAAQHGLWREAEFRFERATELDSTYAAAFNNLAVVYEQSGRMEEAARAYRKALALDPDDSRIQLNYELHVDVADRVPRSPSQRTVADENGW
jgi:Flp pilus assembly protein TadD